MKLTALAIGGGVQFGLLIINLLITSKMHIDDRGIYALVVAVVMTVSSVCNFGFVNALIKRMHEMQLTRSYVINLVYFVFAQVFVAVAIVFSVLLSFPIISIELIYDLWLVIIVTVVSLLLRSYGQALLLGLNKISLFQLSKVIPVFLFAFILIMQGEYFLVDVLFSWMLSEFLLVLFLIYTSITFFRVGSVNSDSVFMEDVKFGFKSLFGHTAFIEGYKFDLIILGYIMPVADLAIYAVSKSVALVLRFVPQSLSQVAYPVILNSSEADRLAVVKRFVSVTIVAGVILMLVGYFLFVEFVMDFLGPDYAESENVVLIMFFGVLAYAPRRVLYEFFKAVNKPAVTSKIELSVITAYLSLLLACETLGLSNILILALMILLVNMVALLVTMNLALKKV